MHYKKRRQIFIWFCLICVYMIPIVSDYIVQDICTKVAKKELIGLCKNWFTLKYSV